MGFSLGNALMGDNKVEGNVAAMPFYTGWGENSTWVAPRVYNPPTQFSPAATPQFSPEASNAAWAANPANPANQGMLAPQPPPQPAPAAPQQPGVSAEVAAAIQSDPAVARYFEELNMKQAAQAKQAAGVPNQLQQMANALPPSWTAPRPRSQQAISRIAGDVQSGMTRLESLSPEDQQAVRQYLANPPPPQPQGQWTPDPNRPGYSIAPGGMFGMPTNMIGGGGRGGNVNPAGGPGSSFTPQMNWGPGGPPQQMPGAMGGNPAAVVDDMGAGGGYAPTGPQATGGNTAAVANYDGGGGSGMTQTAPGGGTQLKGFEPDYSKNNTVFSKYGSGATIPSIWGSTAAEYLNGPPQDYPYKKTAPYSDLQHNADWVLQAGLGDPNNWTNTTGNIARDVAGGGATGQAQGFTGQLINRANSLYDNFMASQPKFEAPTGGASVGQHGLNDFTGQYTQNPHLENIIGSMTNDATRWMNETLLPQDRTAASGAGQYGGSRSGIAEGLTRSRVGEQIVDQSGQLRYGDYNQFNQNKLRAGEALTEGDIGRANASNNLYAAQAQFNLGQQQVQQQALRDILDFNARIGGVANVGSANNINAANVGGNLLVEAGDQALKGNDMLRDAGKDRRAQDQAVINEDIARWERGQNAPRENIEWYNSVVSGAPQQIQTPSVRQSNGTGILDVGIAASQMVPGFGEWLGGMLPATGGAPATGGGGGGGGQALDLNKGVDWGQLGSAAIQMLPYLMTL